jgi:hypothetical protein
MAVNMSYCRFENTLAALEECAQALPDSPADLPGMLASLSRDEAQAARRLLELCAELADAFGDP